ncbi:MAG: DNA adenine methylase, partial [Niameybacter sp.]
LSKTLPYIGLVAKKAGATSYCECFGGGGRCILNLDKLDTVNFDRLIYNEWDEGMCKLFEAASKPDTAEQMIKALRNVNYDKETFDYCKKHKLDKDNSLLETACMTYILCQMSYNANMKSFSKIDYNTNSDIVQNFYNGVDRIILTPLHVPNLEVVNGDYREMLRLYGADPHVVKYLDPPYITLVREKGSLKVYSNELTCKEHKELVELLCNSRSWVLSSYDPEKYGSDIYKKLEEAGAIKVSLGKFFVSSSGKAYTYKEEFIWYKV